MPIVLADFVRSVPQPLTAILVQLSPFIASARYGIEIASWRQSWHLAGFAVACWWAICLSAEMVLRYLLPLLIAGLIVMPRRRAKIVPTTEQRLQAVVTDLETIHSLLPPPPPLPSTYRTPLRIVAILYPPYLLLTYCVPLRILLALAGTLLLLVRAPFTQILIAVFLRSAWCRFTLRHLISLLTAQPLPPIIISQQPTTMSSIAVPELRFLFTIYENQRWWMGLDWTAALLPNERPSWCSAPPIHSPVSPPSAFPLPVPTTVFLSDGKGKRVKRTAIWRWEEPEWKVLVRTDAGRLNRVERPIPDDALSASGGSGSGSRLLKAAGKMRESGIIGGTSTGNGDHDDDEGYDGGPGDAEEDSIPTDPDGWIYGDNKWETLSGKGGIGKACVSSRITSYHRIHLFSFQVHSPTSVDTCGSRS